MAITLAVLGACCFALAAALQHRAVGQSSAATSPDRARHDLSGTLSLSRLWVAVRKPLWLAGSALAGAGAILHLAALSLAPLSVIQPIGILAVPFAVILGASLRKARPAPATVLSVLLCVSGVGFFVWLTVGHAAAGVVPGPSMVIAGLVVAGILAGCTVLAMTGSHRYRSICWAAGAAVAYGFAATLIRGLFQQFQAGASWLDPVIWVTMIAVVIALAIGIWLVQQAYATGPPEIVLGCLTVLDPGVAVLLGITLMGEGRSLDLPTMLGMLLGAAVAVVGVLSLARHHPDVARPEASIAALQTERVK